MHSTYLGSFIDKLLKDNGIYAADIDAIAVSTGPRFIYWVEDRC
jgi:tRNA A37 threonylcarbamoyladenosine modification protein TsaB